MSVTTVLIGVGVFEFLLLLLLTFIWLTSEPRNKHQPLLFAGMLMFVLGLLFIPMLIMQTGSGNCGAVLNSTVIGNTTAYSYDYLCNDVFSDTKLNFFKFFKFFMLFFFLYVFLYLFYQIFGKFLLGWASKLKYKYRGRK